MSTQQVRLESIYQSLDRYAEIVEDSIPFLRDVSSLACLTVLDEDLHSLLGECEDLLMGAEEISKNILCSLECRTVTVLEELKRLTQPPPCNS